MQIGVVLTKILGTYIGFVPEYIILTVPQETLLKRLSEKQIRCFFGYLTNYLSTTPNYFKIKSNKSIRVNR